MSIPASFVKGFWECEEAVSPFLDSTPNNNDLTIIGVTTLDVSLFGFCGYYDGATGDKAFITDGAQTDLDLGTDSATIISWFEDDNFGGGTGRFLLAKRDGATRPFWQIDTTGGLGTLSPRFYCGDANPINDKFVMCTSFTTGTKQCVIAVVDRVNDQLRIYLNGVLEATSGSIAALGTLDSAGNFSIGNADAGTQYWHGPQDRVAVLKGYAATNADATWIYNGGAGRAYSEYPAPLPPFVYGIGITMLKDRPKL